MKKTNIIAVAAVIALSASMLAACGSDKTSDEVSETTTTAATEEQPVETEDDGEEDIIPEETDIVLDVIEESEGASDEVQTEEEAAPNPLMPYVEAAMADSEWPVLDEVNDPVILEEFFLLDKNNENYEELIVMQCPISAVMSEIIIIKAADTDSAEADLEARRTKAIERDAWYPKDQELAEASIVGVSGSYAYFIIGENAASAETALIDYISANG